MREGVTSAFTSTGAKIAGLIGAVGIAEFAKSSLELASNLAEVQNVVDTTFGDMSSKINDFAKTTSSQFGISELQAKQFSGTLGAMMKSSGIAGDKLADMSTNLAGLAGDIASFYNLDPQEAFEKIKSAISGETEPMKALGVNMSVANMEAFALTQGITKQYKAMSQAEQTQLRYNYLMKNTADAQGDYAKTSDSFANALRTLKLNVQTVGGTIMNYAIPPFQELFGKINKFITSIDVKSFMENKVIPAFKTFKTVIDAVKENMKTIVPIVSGVVGGLAGFMIITKISSEVRNFMKVLSSIAKFTNPFYLIAAGIGLLIAGFVHAYNTSDDFRDRVNKLVGKLMDFGDYASEKLPGIIDTLTGVFQNDLEPALDKIGKFAEDIFNYVNDHYDSMRTTVKLITGAVVSWKLALMAVNTWTKIVGVTTKIYETLSLAIWGVKNAATLCEGAMWLLDVAMDANPVGVVCLAIGALILVIYEVVNHFQDFVDWCYKAWDVVTNNPILMFIQTVLAPWLTVLEAVVTHWNQITDAIKSAWNWLTDWNNTKAEDKNINVTTTQSVVTAKDNSSVGDNDYNPQIVDSPDHSATGQAYWKGGKTTTSEFSDEAIQLPSGSKVFTAKQSEQLLSGAGGRAININLNVQGNVISDEDFKNEVGQHIYNQVKLALVNS
ncbi:hypothetical protein CLOBY_18180 [Clostridium saccharobutylicum]|uniref:hypothetical protein n=1 Tax=Clostridium saccharobutylicum TaxID=169679 RepID=UPI0009839DC6|nr:hypothetical protein [Clostridium saccharobutylicum]AQS09687.1 hypothetical protein CLOBY_18180 [Clostridium saccharobutylicum]MBC2436918.1 hypothetical protein [Clostridium saccharobutylicum]NSB89268.1 hypothetical protein [Clostridium saccharobutylicum]NYC27922.1 hypothetical protein [Clostridium saccharobutylicum]OOM17118.1 hypothetical protein CLSAB_20660 [Clostridium saccharobutylicum]